MKIGERKIRWLGEFILIVVGVLTALAVNDLNQARDDRALEGHLLAGIREDLMRDTVDSDGAILAAQGRAAGADELLEFVNDPQAGKMASMGRKLDERLRDVRVKYPTHSFSPRQALLLTGDQRRLDLSTATFSEAIARGGFDKMRDLSLRTMIATHYFNAVRYARADDRVEANSLRYRGVLAESGLAPGDGENGEAMINLLRRRPVLIAEIKNLREFALFQIQQQNDFMTSARQLLAAIDAWLAERKV